jgi:hypothetical protein
VAIIRDNTTATNTLKVNADGSINTTLNFPASGLEIANDVGNPVPVSDGGLSLTVDGTVGINNFPATQAVSGTVAVNNFPATQAVSGTVTANAGSGTFSTSRTWSLAFATDKADVSGSSVAVSNFPATQAVSGTVSIGAGTQSIGNIGSITNAVTVNQGTSGASAWPVTVGNFPATQAVSGTVAATQSGTWTTGRTWNLSGATDSLNVANFPATQSVSGTVLISTTPTAFLFADAPPSVTVSTTGAAAAAATLTIPAAPAGQFIYVTALSIQMVNSAARAAAAATLITVTTSGISGTPTFNYGQPVTTVGTTDVTWANMAFSSPIKGTAAATAATISAPATTGVLWVVRAHYYYAP